MTQRLYQTDAYLKSTQAEVISCRSVPEGYEVLLSQTILYPEGGGQPSDFGTIDGQAVQKLYRDDDGAIVHLVEQPVSGSVKVELDWDRRYDHMQQHTAQHIITATALAEFDLPTTAFHMGETRSDVELDTPSISTKLKTDLEERVNQIVRDGRDVAIRYIDHADMEKYNVRSRILPQGFSGTMRLVEIDGIDLNTCGGTHVANTKELQSICLLHTESLRGGMRIFFVAGGRVTRLLRDMAERERAFNAMLSCGPDQHQQSVERLLAEVKSADIKQRRLQNALCQALAEQLAHHAGVATHHLAEGDMNFLRTLASAAREKNPNLVALLTAGEKTGFFVLIGPDATVDKYGPKVAKILGGRGGGKSGIFQGKYANLARMQEALSLLQSIGD